jgi:hypothetical protein
MNIFNKKVVQEALKQTWAFDNTPALTPGKVPAGQSTITSMLIHDIFGGEILKTHKKKGWHFYNLIEGERVDFAISEMGNSLGKKQFEDISSTPDETHNYFVQEDYITFFMRFVMAFEEAVGLKKYQSGYSS